ADLRRALGREAGRLNAPTPRTIALEVSAGEVDVLAFDRAIARGDAGSLETAIALYRGPLMDGCLEEWVLPEREARRQAYLAALDRLADRALETGKHAEAIRRLRLLLAADPLRESSHRSLMRAEAACGDYAAATQVYRDLR